jgi:hypothetical protein
MRHMRCQRQTQAAMTIRSFIMTMLGALLAVLTLASPASAECAWILWRLTKGAGMIQPTWQTAVAVSERSECASALARDIAEASSLSVPTVKVTQLSSGYVTSWVDSVIWVAGVPVELQCLPDTVDPRGPKGAAR